MILSRAFLYILDLGHRTGDFTVPAALVSRSQDRELLDSRILVPSEEPLRDLACPACNAWAHVFRRADGGYAVACLSCGETSAVPEACVRAYRFSLTDFLRWYAVQRTLLDAATRQLVESAFARYLVPDLSFTPPETDAKEMPRANRHLERRGRFDFPKDRTYLCDWKHTGPAYRGLTPYAPLHESNARRFIFRLIAQGRKNEGWLPNGTMKDDFKSPAYVRFKDEQMQVPRIHEPHYGESRIIPDELFDYLSPLGRFYKRALSGS